MTSHRALYWVISAQLKCVCLTEQVKKSRCAMVLGAVFSRGGLELWVIGAPGYRDFSYVAKVPIFQGIR